jgi:hypothetical protein
VEGADYATLKDAPEAFNRVRVDRADDVLAFAVVNDTMRKYTVKASVRQQR